MYIIRPERIIQTNINSTFSEPFYYKLKENTLAFKQYSEEITKKGSQQDKSQGQTFKS